MWNQNVLWSCTYVCIIVLFIETCHSQQLYLFQGESCLSEDNKNGTCKLLNECKTAKNKLKQFNIKPIICSFQGIEPIVCCEEENQQLINRDYNLGDTCNLKNGNPGSCELVSHCKFQTSSIYAEDWNWCGEERRSPICCHKKKPKHIIACNSYKILYGIPEITIVLSKTPDGFGGGVGGYSAKYGEFPHMALIGFGTENNKVWSCGGTLISENFVLTAAHCLYLQGSGDARFVRLGELDLESTNKTIQPQDFNIVERIPHPDYRAPIVYNDIALLRLERNVSFTDFIHPACLYDKYTVPFPKLNATGWGATEYLGDLNNHLLIVELSTYTFEECYPHYNSQTHKRVLPHGIDNNTHICSGGRGEYKDTCQGDSGGPLQIQDYADVHNIIGVTSFGKACAIGNSPGVYTRVSAFIPWIENIVWP